jgi:hypothetical protein
MNEEWCRAASTAFQQKTGIQVRMTCQSAGETHARLKAEKDILADDGLRRGSLVLASTPEIAEALVAMTRDLLAAPDAAG